MDNQRLILWHWEALYPFDLVAKGISSLKLPEEFPQDSMLIALPHDYLVQTLATLKDSKFHFGSSDMLDATPGTFTSSIAASFLVESRANFVIIGKAFDRNQIKESSISIHHKIRAALKEKITPFFCFGETREEFEDGHAEEIIKKQMSDCLASLPPEEIKQINFVYDTPGAVKTISAANSKDLNKVYAMAQKQYVSLWGNEVAKEIKTICALEPFKPLPKELFENSPFAGFYFKMIDANLTFFCEAAKEIAPFFGKISMDPNSLARDTTSTTVVDTTEKIEESNENETEASSAPPTTLGVPALAPTQILTIHTDLSVDTFLKQLYPEDPTQPSEEIK